MQVSDSSLGPYLRSEREQQGIDLQDIAELTKIQPKFIKAIEDDAYDQLPKGPFVAGFLRSYAECLSIDADEVVTFYHANHSVAVLQVSLPPVRHTRAAQPTRKPRASSRRGGILSVGLLALACGLLYLLWSGQWEPRVAPTPGTEAATEVSTTRRVAPSSAAPVTLTPATPPLQEPAAPSAEAQSSVPNLSNHDASPITTPIAIDVHQADVASSDESTTLSPETPAPELAPLLLRVYALEETWMRLDIDDDNRQEALIKAGQSQQWEAKEQFSLTIGNVQGARVFLDNQELDLPATRSNVLRDYTLTRALLNPRHTD